MSEYVMELMMISLRQLRLGCHLQVAAQNNWLLPLSSKIKGFLEKTWTNLKRLLILRCKRNWILYSGYLSFICPFFPELFCCIVLLYCFILFAFPFLLRIVVQVSSVVTVPSLPRTASNKVMRRVLRQNFSQSKQRAKL